MRSLLEDKPVALVLHVKHSDDKVHGMIVPAAHQLDCGYMGSEKGNLTIWCACSNSAEAQTMQNALRQFHSDWPNPTVLMSTTHLTFKVFADNVELDDVIAELPVFHIVTMGLAACNYNEEFFLFLFVNVIFVISPVRFAV